MLVVKTIPNQVRAPSHHRAGMPRFAESSTASRRGWTKSLEMAVQRASAKGTPGI